MNIAIATIGLVLAQNGILHHSFVGILMCLCGGGLVGFAIARAEAGK